MKQKSISEIKKAERSWQDRKGGGFQLHSYERRGTRVVINRQYARIAEALQLASGMRLLDLGCGAGLFLAWMARQVRAKYHGLDLSLNSLKSIQGSNSFGLIQGDAELLPFRDGSFDRISYNGAAHHLLDLRAALHEAYRVLVPGGIVVLYEPTASGVTNAVRELFLSSNKYESPADLAKKSELTEESVHRELVDAGFVQISSSHHDFLAYPLSGMYLNLPFGRWGTLMAFLTRLENQIENWTILKPLTALIAWRLLVVATKPKNEGGSVPASAHAAD